MNKSARHFIFKRLAQTTSSPTAPTPTTPTNVPPVNLASLPRFRSALFSVKPSVINNLNQYATLINNNLVKLSNGKVQFNQVYTTPSITGSEYSNDLKSFFNLAIKLYSFVSVNRNPYSILELRTFALNTIANIKSISFQYTDAQGKIISLLNTMLAELGTR